MADTARIEELRRRVQMDPASIAFAALAEEYRRSRQFDDAIATCRTGLQRHPAYLSARVTLGRSLLEIGRYDEARQELEHVLRVAPENLAAIRALAEIHHRAGELPESEPHFSSAEPEDVPAAAAAPQPLAPQPAVLSTSPAAATAQPQGTSPPLQPALAPAAVQAAPRLAPQVAAPVAPQTTASVVTLTPVPPPPPAPTPPQPHPDEVALPALEIFLSAIVAARISRNRIPR
jgi:tetratricopeptide (TPR) repeat protein